MPNVLRSAMKAANAASLCEISPSCSASRYFLSLSLIFSLPPLMRPSCTPDSTGLIGPTYALSQYLTRNSLRGVYATCGSMVARYANCFFATIGVSQAFAVFHRYSEPLGSDSRMKLRLTSQPRSKPHLDET